MAVLLSHLRLPFRCVSLFQNEKMDATLSRAFSNSSMVSPTIFLIDFKLQKFFSPIDIMTKFVARSNIPSVWIEQCIIIFSSFRIQLIDFDLQLRKVINVFLNRGSVMAFCTKIFLWESHGSRWIIRSHKSQLVIYCFQSLASFPLALSFSHETAVKAFLVGTSGPKR